jgi:hypothetical protein
MAIDSLSQAPARCPVIPEAEELGFPARHLLYGKRGGVYRIKRGGVYRIIFDIREEERHCPHTAHLAQFAGRHYRRRREGLLKHARVDCLNRVSTDQQGASGLALTEYD